MMAGSRLEISVEGSNAPLKDGKTKGGGQADFINALTDEKPPGRGHAFPDWRESTRQMQPGEEQAPLVLVLMEHLV